MNSYQDFDWNSVGLDFGNWEEEKIWALELPVEILDISELIWHLDVPFWTNDEGERWSLTPRDVLDNSAGSDDERARVAGVDISYPIDIFENKGKWLVLDGLHRLAKCYQDGNKTVQVRKIPHERFIEIKSEHPIELPKVY